MEPIECIAVITSILGKWIIGNKHKSGYLILIVAAVCWLGVGISNHLYGIIVYNSIVVFVEFRNCKIAIKSSASSTKVGIVLE